MDSMGNRRADELRRIPSRLERILNDSDVTRHSTPNNHAPGDSSGGLAFHFGHGSPSAAN